MRRALLLLALVISTSATAAAQRNSAEVNFEKNRVRYSRERFSEGEDASSGFDYVYFRSGKDIVMIRTIWSATYTREMRIEDMYFNNGGLALYRRSTAQKKSLTVLKSGRNIGLSPKEEQHFENSKLVRWIDNGQPVDKLAASWPETERATLQTAKSWLESYNDLKKTQE